MWAARSSISFESFSSGMSSKYGVSLRTSYGGDLPPNQLGRQRRQPIVSALRPAVLDRNVLTLDEAGFLQSLAECAQAPFHDGFRRCGAEEPDHRHRRLLRPCRERPRGCGAAEQRNEFAAPHSITSSARCCKNHGTSSPSAVAVLRLMTRSNLVGCTTGKSPGLAPLSIRPA